ncbi:MAG TPA: NAD(P)-dependent glycerol-3-phosphate dehydrogenase [Clostridia bacterium]|nr:NAD(P)-dependent glycerol-3-phosphate dehydrogenase [Clostridia bacterium]
MALGADAGAGAPSIHRVFMMSAQRRVGAHLLRGSDLMLPSVGGTESERAEESPFCESPVRDLTDCASIGIIGAGSWGTALAIHLGRKGFRVKLLSRDAERARLIQRERVNRRFLPEVTLPDTVTVSCDPSSLADCHDAVVFAVPSQALREAVRWAATGGFGAVRCDGVRPKASGDSNASGGSNVWGDSTVSGDSIPVVVSAAKGLEVSSLLRMSEVIVDELGDRVKQRLAVISGPNFAKEVALGLPGATVAAAYSETSRRRVQDLFMSDCLRVYTNPDVIGVELGGALKNIYAIGVGIIDGLGLGMNARAAFITRALAELTRLGVACGARASTFSGLSGLGDLVLTCTGYLSRNRRCGLALARGERLDEIIRESKEVIEGVPATNAAFTLAMRLDVEMPILTEMYQVLFEGKNLREASKCLMTRLKKDEIVDMA